MLFMPILTLANEKGGIGKTSMCFNSGWHFAERGKKVLMIDLDGQRANLTFFCGVSKPENLATMYDVLAKGEDIKKTILSIEPNLDLIPATDTVISLNETNASFRRMKESLNEIKDRYDYILIDVSPTPNRSHALALSIADFVLVPMMADVTCLAANMGIAESIQLIQENINPNLKVLGIVFNRYNWRSTFSREVHETAEAMVKALDSKVFKTKLRTNIALSKNVGSHEGVTTYDPRSKAAEDIKNFCKEIEREVKNYGR